MNDTAATTRRAAAPARSPAARHAASVNGATDLRGASKVLIDAVTGVTGIVEDMHRHIARVGPIVGKAKPGNARGISGLVYKSVRGVTRAVGFGLDTALGRLAPLVRPGTTSPRREVVLAALNGVLGDYLEQTGNPLAITMRFRHQGHAVVLERDALAADFAQSGGKLLVLVHGLCMSDLQWRRELHDHGAALASDLGFTPLYLHYNSGRHIAANGREFAALLDQLVRQWPVPVSELVIVGHSMGGLVARSACEVARQSKMGWLKRVKKIVFLGTPHHGSPLERAGNWVDMLLGVSPYTAPFARLGQIRSAGIQDLRHGTFIDGDLRRQGSEVVPLPRGVKCFVLAASKQAAAGHGTRMKGDGLVPVNSALGRHKDAALTLSVPAARQHVVFGIDHFDLLSSDEVYRQLRGWLEN